MCSPAMFIGGSTLFSAASTLYAGQQQASAYKTQAKQYDIQRIEARTQHSQASRDRMNEFRQTEQQNRLAIALSGFTQNSFKSLTDANRVVAQEDAARIEAKGRQTEKRLKFQARDARNAARAVRVGSLFTAGSTIAEGGARIAAL